MIYCSMCENYIKPGIPNEDGQLCFPCQSREILCRAERRRLTDQGHTFHCACRQIWGDGECECGLHIYERGSGPYKWVRHFRRAEK